MAYETTAASVCPCAGPGRCPQCGNCASCCNCPGRELSGELTGEVFEEFPGELTGEIFGNEIDEIEGERGRRARPARRPVQRVIRRRVPLRMPIWGAVAQAAGAVLPEPMAAPATEPPAAPADTFTPVAVETPGGGRIKNKTAPPKDQLVTVTGTAKRKIPLHRLTAAAWQALVAAARRDGLAAPLLLPTSGFRDPAHQARLWKTALARYGSPEAARKWVAPPGSSPHQTGRAIDFYLGGSNGSAHVAKLRTLPAYRWMVANAQRFGFYPYPAEPWHWEYNPPAQTASEVDLGELGLVGELDRYHPVRPRPQPAAATTGLRGRIVATALSEWQKWNAGGRRTETDPRMRAILADYWKSGAGVNVRESDLGLTAFQASHPWSAAFISWVMKKAGAGPAFRYSAAHAVYTAAARQNRLSNNGNPFQAFRVSEAAPALGDLVCKSRAGSGATYDNVRAGMKTHCDVVVAVAPGQITVVGGNVDNSVSRKTVRTNAAGLLTGPEYFAVIRSGPLAGSPQPAPRPAPAPPRPAPGPSGSTVYAPIDLEIKDGAGNRVKPQTGIFCPPGWRPSGPIDLVIYLHGIRDPRITIDSYWNAARHPHFALREDLASSGKNAVLVAPLLGPRSQNQVGILGRPGGLDRFVGSVLSALAQQARLPEGTQAGNIILACHSGGGLAMRIIALANNKLAGRIRECWGYDCTYNRDDFTVWPRWAAQRNSSRLVMFYLPGTKTAAQALKLKQRGVTNVTVVASRARNHNWVPRAHFLEQLKQTPALRSIVR